MSLEAVAKFAIENDIQPIQQSGKQEYLENIVNNYIYK